MKSAFAAIAATCLLSLSLPAAAQSDAPGASRPHCFYSNQIQNWKAPDARTIYLRVGLHRYYRLELSHSCHALRSPGAFLVTKIRGPNTVCSAIDWDLHVANSWRDIPQACIVKNMVELSPEEAAALPKGSKP